MILHCVKSRNCPSSEGEEYFCLEFLSLQVLITSPSLPGASLDGHVIISVTDNVYTTKCSSALIVDVLGMGVDLTKAYSAERFFIRFSINRRLIVGLESKTGALGGVVVAARDTDAFILLLAHFEKMSCPKIWMKAGTSKKQKYIPIHTIAAHLDSSLLGSLPAFHSVSYTHLTLPTKRIV